MLVEAKSASVEISRLEVFGIAVSAPFSLQADDLVVDSFVHTFGDRKHAGGQAVLHMTLERFGCLLHWPQL